MQCTELDCAQIADTLATTTTLMTLDQGGLIVNIITGSYGDAILIQNAGTGGGVLIQDELALDIEAGGSIHNHARQIAGRTY